MNWSHYADSLMLDPAVQVLPFEVQRHFLMLVLKKLRGYLRSPVSDEIAATALSISAQQCAAIKTLLLQGKFIDAGWTLLWGPPHRSRTGGAAERQRRYRERKRQEAAARRAATSEDASVTPVTPPVTSRVTSRVTSPVTSPVTPEGGEGDLGGERDQFLNIQEDQDLSSHSLSDPAARTHAVTPDVTSRVTPVTSRVTPPVTASEARAATPPRDADPFVRFPPSPGPREYPAEFEAAKAVYPPADRPFNWHAAWREWRIQLYAGVAPEAMLQGAQRYRVYCDAAAKTAERYVMDPKKFFGPERHFTVDWALPSKKLDPQIDTLSAAAAEQREQALTAASRAAGDAFMAQVLRERAAAQHGAGTERTRNGNAAGFRAVRSVLAAMGPHGAKEGSDGRAREGG